MYPNLVGINTISLLRLAQRGDRAGGKIRGATLPTLARAYSHTVESTRYWTHTRTVTVHVRAITSSFPLLVSRFLDFAAVTDNRSFGLLQHSLALRMTLSSAHSAFLSPTPRPKAVAFFRFPQERVRAELRACPSDPLHCGGCRPGFVTRSLNRNAFRQTGPGAYPHARPYAASLLSPHLPYREGSQRSQD